MEIEMNNIIVLMVFLIFSTLTIITSKSKEWIQCVMCFLWGCYIIYILCFKNSVW